MKKQKHTNNCMSRQNLDTTVYISTVEVKIYVDNELDSIEQDRRVLYTDYNTLVSELRRLEDLYPAPSYRFDILIEVGDTFEFPRLTREVYNTHRPLRHIFMRVYKYTLPERPWVRRAG